MSLDKKIRRYCEVDPMDFFRSMPREPDIDLPELDITINPPFAEFIDFGGASKHRICNTGSSKIVFKVKCSNNELFKVNPVYAFLNPGASTDLQILRREGPNKSDKLIVMYKAAVKGERDPRKQFELPGIIEKKGLPLITREPEDRY